MQEYILALAIMEVCFPEEFSVDAFDDWATITVLIGVIISELGGGVVSFWTSAAVSSPIMSFFCCVFDD